MDPLMLPWLRMMMAGTLRSGFTITRPWAIVSNAETQHCVSKLKSWALFS